jgi:hypothetical protein
LNLREFTRKKVKFREFGSTVYIFKISIKSFKFFFHREHRKKELGFNDLIKLLHKQLPLNIISQHIDITQLDHAEMTKMLRITLIDKGEFFYEFIQWWKICVN